MKKVNSVDKTIVLLAILIVLFFSLWGISYFHSSFYLPFFIIVSICLFIVNVFSLVIVFNKSLSPWKIVTLFVSLGTIYNFILPACTVPDEDFHFASAYKLSNCILYQVSIDEQTEVMLMRPDISNSLIRSYNAEALRSYYRDFIGISHERDDYYSNNNIVNTPYTYYQYWFPALAISACRILKLSAPLLLFIGREANLILFSLVIYFAFRILPSARTTFSIIMLFPMTMILAASYSYDSIIISTLMLYYSIIMKCNASAEPIALKEMMVISLLFIFTIPIKLVYFPIILLLFFINSTKFGKLWYKYAWIAIISILTASIIIISHGATIKYLFTKEAPTVNTEISLDSDNSDSVNYDDTSHNWTISDAKSNPLEFIGVNFRSLFDTSNQLFMNISGYYFGWFSYEIPITIACIFPVLFFISIYADSSTILDNLKKTVLLLIVIAIFSLIMLSMLLTETPYGAIAVVGVQGRYFIPLMPLVALALKANTKINIEGLSSKLVYVSVFTNSIVILYLLNDVLNY